MGNTTVGTTNLSNVRYPSGKSKRTALRLSCPAKKEVSIALDRASLYWAQQSFQCPLAMLRKPLRLLRPPKFGWCAMALLMIGLITVGVLGDGFMLYVLLKWMHE
jgi:hypothetical protein